jgi:caffeoyl-CoA O-methyltransferase
MTGPKSFFLSPELHGYVVAHGTPPDAVQQGLIDETAQLPMARMQISPEQGAFMTLLVRAVAARRAVEVGTFTGYSALAIARGLPDDGQLLCCDVSEEWTAIARRAWETAGVAHKIELRLAPAIQTLQGLPFEEHLDLAFLDADKTSYAAYYEELLPRLRPNGLLLVDNTLWSGRVLDAPADDDDDDTVALRAFNELLAADDRVDTALLTIGDGLTLVRKK